MPRQKFCQGLCDTLKNNPPVGRKKYENHVYCTRCDAWMLQEAMKANGRCPCCNFRPRWKGWKNKNVLSVGS